MVTGALQSGYSAGAMMMVTKALLARTPNPTEAEIRDALSGVLDLVESGRLVSARWLVDLTFNRRSPELAHRIRKTVFQRHGDRL
jgi:plasmid stability protein